MHRETRIVPYPADLMYRVVAEVEHYPEFLPWCAGLRVKSRTADGVIAEMLVGYGSFREKYTSRVTLDPAHRRIDVVQTDGPFRKLENHWRFTPSGDDCEVDFAIDFAFRNRILGAVAGAAFEKVLLKMTEAFEARAKALQQGAAKA
ncbi:MAG: type toxin-antitoxin system RatA family toxin [Alphaproteobacteria bacterium]|nr:type toxin-antitoxin system RatA family toxin [Alphaproteobacteria bacterium]